MIKYLITGSEAEVKKVLQENRIRKEMGLIDFAPFSQAESEDDTEEMKKHISECMEVIKSKDEEIASLKSEIEELSKDSKTIEPLDSKITEHSDDKSSSSDTDSKNTDVESDDKKPKK